VDQWFRLREDRQAPADAGAGDDGGCVGLWHEEAERVAVEAVGISPDGATLTIAGGSLTGGTVTAGSGNSGGATGHAYGGGLFLQGNETITLAPLV